MACAYEELMKRFLIFSLLLIAALGFAQAQALPQGLGIEVSTPVTNPPPGTEFYYLKTNAGLCAKTSAGTEICPSGSGFPNPMTTEGDIIYQHSAAATRLGVGTTGNCLTSNGTDPVWGSCSGSGNPGTVTSVGLTVPSVLTVTGSPVTTAGVLAVTFTTGQTANLFLATPNGSTGAVGLRAIVTADLPSTLVGSQTAKTFYAAPNGSAGAPTFRLMLASDVPTLNQSTTGNAATATALAATPTQCGSNNFSTGIAASGNANCSQPTYANLGGSVPTWNQNTTGTAAGLSGTPALPNGTTATTQTTGDTSTKLATDAFVAAAIGTGIADIQISITASGVNANSCLPTNSTYYTAAMTGVTTGMSFNFSWSTDYHAVSGWNYSGPVAYFASYPTANQLNYQVCNNSSTNITFSSNTTWNVSAK